MRIKAYICSLIASALLLIIGNSHAQTTITSGAAGIVGGGGCTITIHWINGCQPCTDLKNLHPATTSPDACPKIVHTRSGGNPKFNYPQVSWSDGVTTAAPSTQAMEAAQKFCESRCSSQPVNPQPPSKPEQPKTTPATGYPTAANFICRDGARCMYGCDNTTPNGCLECPSFTSSCPICPSGKTCITKINPKGCPQNASCEASDAPPTQPSGPGDEGGSCSVDENGNTVCTPGETDTKPDIKPDSTPQPKQDVDPVPEVDPKQPLTCDNPCPNATNPNNCCKPTEGCSPRKQCETFTGCANCKTGQVCKPIEAPPYYGCMAK
jgi:hypothetical protein